MKKRKIKLFASVASLAMVAAVMGVGVWAATTQSVTVNSTVEFSATSILGNVTLYAGGAATSDAKIDATSIKGEAAAATVLSITEMTAANGAQDAQNVAVTLADSNNDGYFDEKDGTITYTFTITNTGDEGLYYNVTVGEATTIGAESSQGTWTATGAATNKAGEAIAKNLDAEVTITFTYSGADQIKIDAAAANLPTVTVTLGNANVAATWQ